MEEIIDILENMLIYAKNIEGWRKQMDNLQPNVPSYLSIQERDRAYNTCKKEHDTLWTEYRRLQKEHGEVVRAYEIRNLKPIHPPTQPKSYKNDPIFSPNARNEIIARDLQHDFNYE